MGAEAIAALSAHAPACPFGKRERSLFDSKAGAAYVARVAKRCIALVDQDFAHPENWSNLAREGIGIGGLAPLLVLDPCVVPTKKGDRWRRAAKEGLAALEAAPDGELDFHRQYYASLDTVLALLVKRADKHAS